MDEQTREYRIKELGKVDYITGEFCPAIKIYGEAGQQTKVLNISWTELDKIKELLTR